MKILVVGSGGREHTLAWKLAQSPRAEHIFVAPGNGGTQSSEQGECAISSIAIPADATDGFAALITLAQQERIGLTVIGPEMPLADGIVDAFEAAGLACFGPPRAAAQLEGSKTFSKAFMHRHAIPTAEYAAFSDYPAALRYLGAVDRPLVIKASGLAAGKGVIVPAGHAEAAEALHQIMVERAFGAAGDEVIIEERLDGQEASVLAFCDGKTVVAMPAAQDHKRVFDDDAGPNTGGMGAYAPAPLVTPALMAEVMRRVLQPTIDGMAAEGCPYRGVLYAGLMIGATGLRVLEYNCRFGDPETQVILPLLESDLVTVVEACLAGELDARLLQWRAGSTATVVAAAGGYPGPYRKGDEIRGLDQAAAQPGVTLFHAGTRRTPDGRLLTDGGRVLAVTGTGGDLRSAIEHAYTGMARIHFEGMHYRRDIGAKAL